MPGSKAKNPSLNFMYACIGYSYSNRTLSYILPLSKIAPVQYAQNLKDSIAAPMGSETITPMHYKSKIIFKLILKSMLRADNPGSCTRSGNG